MFKKSFGLTIVAAVIAVQPAAAQSLVDAGIERAGQGHARLGAFAGARMRLAIGGVRHEPVRAGLTLAGVRMLDRADGRRSADLSDGLSFGFADGKRPVWSLAGQPLSGPQARLNMTTTGKVALIVGGVLLVGGIAFAVWVHEIEKASD